MSETPTTVTVPDIDHPTLCWKQQRVDGEIVGLGGRCVQPKGHAGPHTWETPTTGTLRQRIREYFDDGGLFHPELMEHDKVRDLLGDIDAYLAAPLPGQPTQTAEGRMFPIQFEVGAKAHPFLIPWWVAERAYGVYAAEFGRSQSLERLAQRGGFCPSEMDSFYPEWREVTKPQPAPHASQPHAELIALAETWRRLADDFRREAGHDRARSRLGMAQQKESHAARLDHCASELLDRLSASHAERGEQQ